MCLSKQIMLGHITIEMGFIPSLFRQGALSRIEWIDLLHAIIIPRPAEAEIIDDYSDTESDAGWYPDIETGITF